MFIWLQISISNPIFISSINVIDDEEYEGKTLFLLNIHEKLKLDIVAVILNLTSFSSYPSICLKTSLINKSMIYTSP